MTLLLRWCLVAVVLFGTPSSSNSGVVAADRHPFYVSVTEIAHNAAEKTLEISCKFFADDFETTLERAFKTAVDVTAAKDKALLDKLIPAYVGRHLALAADGKPVKLTYLGYEKERESVYCYFEVQQLPAVKKLDVTNTLLYDFTADEINIVHAAVGGRQQSAKLTHPAAKAAFQF